MRIISLLFALVCLLSCSKSSDRSKLPVKPNIVFIFADDQCYNTVNALGNKELITPNLDKLVDDGITFTNTYNMGAWNGAVCVASRAMLNTGQPVWRAQHAVHEIKKGERLSWGQLMREQGYDTYMTGKWHVHMSSQNCFDNVVHERQGMPKDNWVHVVQEKAFANLKEGDDFRKLMPIGYNRPLSKNDNSWSPVDTAFGGFWKGGQHWSEALRDDAIGFINQAKESEKPFFMYLAFNAPHDPRQAPQKYQDMYDDEQLSIPENFLAIYNDKDAIGNGPSLRDAALAPFPRTEYATQVHKKEYYASITHMDAQVGAILQALKESGKADNTYIIYTADHGLAVGEHGLFGKQNMYDHSVRAPFMIVGPGLEKGKKLECDIYLQDAMATALDLAGSKQTEDLFFKSILPQALGESSESNYNGVYGAYLNCQRMIRKDGYKLILYPDIKRVKLFDLTKDSLEMNNLAKNDNQQQRVKSLFNSLKALQIQMGDTLNLDAFYNL